MKKKLSEFEKKWGIVCSKCKLRKGTVLTTNGAEGGKDSYCKCSKNER